jgi:hypothetical protein
VNQRACAGKYNIYSPAVDAEFNSDEDTSKLKSPKCWKRHIEVSKYCNSTSPRPAVTKGHPVLHYQTRHEPHSRALPGQTNF